MLLLHVLLEVDLPIPIKVMRVECLYDGDEDDDVNDSKDDNNVGAMVRYSLSYIYLPFTLCLPQLRHLSQIKHTIAVLVTLFERFLKSFYDILKTLKDDEKNLCYFLRI